MASKELKLIISAQDKTLAAFNSVKGSLDSIGINFKQMAKVGTVAFTAIAGAVGFSVKEAIKAQTAQNRLAQLLKVTNNATEEQVAVLLDQAEALEKVGVMSKDNIVTAQSQLATFDLQIDSIKALTPSIMDYVVAEKGMSASTEDVRSLTNGLAQALNGNFSSLTKTGFVLDDVTKNLISNGTELERAEALASVLDSTYKDFNKTATETAEGSLILLNRSFGDIKEEIGKAFLPILKQLVDKLLPVLEKIKVWAEENPKLLTTIIVVSGAIAGLITNIGLFGLAIPNIIKGIGLLKVAFKLLGIAIHSSMGLIGLALLAISAYIYMVVKNWESIKKGAEIIWTAISDFFVKIFNTIKDTIVNTWNNIETFFVDKWNAIKNKAIEIWDSISNFFKTTLDNIKNFFTDFWNSISTIDGLEKMLEKVASQLLKLQSMLITYLVDTWSSWIESLLQFFADLWNKTYDGLSNWLKKVGEWFASLPDKFTTWLDNTLIAFGQWSIDVENSIKTGMGNWLKSMSDWFHSLPKSASEWLNQTWTSIKEWFMNLFTTSESVEATNKASVDMVNSMVESLDKNKLALIGKWSLIIIGVILSLPALLVVSILTFITQIILKMVQNLQEKAPEIKKALVDMFVNAFNAVIDIVTEKLNWIASKISSVISSIGSIGTKVSNAVFGGGKASGGFVSSNKSYLVGEQGPEIFSPSMSGSIIPNSKIGGGGNYININITGNTIQTADDITELVNEGLNRALRLNNQLSY